MRFPPVLGKMLSPRALHEYRCYLLGIRNPADVQQAWDDEEPKRQAVKATARRRGRR